MLLFVGTETSLDKIASTIVIIVTVVVTYAAFRYLKHLTNGVKPQVIYARRKSRYVVRVFSSNVVLCAMLIAKNPLLQPKQIQSYDERRPRRLHANTPGLKVERQPRVENPVWRRVVVSATPIIVRVVPPTTALIRRRRLPRISGEHTILRRRRSKGLISAWFPLSFFYYSPRDSFLAFFGLTFTILFFFVCGERHAA